MNRRFYQIKYPVWECRKESWKHFEEIYKLSVELAGRVQLTPPRCSSLEKCWIELAVFWEKNPIAVCNSELMFETLYHICFRKFSKNMQDPTLMRLILLVEDELLTCSFAFKVWLKTESFKEAFDEITAPLWYNPTFRKVYDGELYMYLTYRVTKLVMMKNLNREKWIRLFGDFDYSHPYSTWKIYWYVDEYENAVQFLIPNACLWNEEWADRSTMVACIRDLYDVDFSNDIQGLDSLINATKHRKDIETCTRYLYKTKACSPQLLHHLWGADFAKKLQCGFLSLCKRYKTAKKNVTTRGRYEHTKFVNHWIFKQIDDWRRDKSVVLSDKVRAKLFNVGLGI